MNICNTKCYINLCWHFTWCFICLTDTIKKKDIECNRCNNDAHLKPPLQIKLLILISVDMFHRAVRDKLLVTLMTCSVCVYVSECVCVCVLLLSLVKNVSLFSRSFSSVFTVAQVQDKLDNKRRESGKFTGVERSLTERGFKGCICSVTPLQTSPR